jgi:hypothetical protein
MKKRAREMGKPPRHFGRHPNRSLACVKEN